MTYLKGLPPLQRFWFQVWRSGGGCWLWTGGKNKWGYAQFSDGTKIVRVHRWAYEHFVGPIPDGMQLDHLCRVRHCVNPNHLEPVTHAENQRRGDAFSGVNARKTHCIRGHEFTPDNIYVQATRPNGRICLTCRNDAQAAQNRKRKLERAGR